MKLVMLGKAPECRLKRVILAITTLQQTAGVSGAVVLRIEIRVRGYGLDRYSAGKEVKECGVLRGSKEVK